MRLRYVIIAFLICTAPCLAADNEKSTRDAIRQQTATYLAQRNFSGLNKLAEIYRVTEEKTPSGYWKLSWFYEGLRSPTPNGSADDSQWNVSFKNAADWIQKAPSPAAYIALANLHIGYAWQVRGGGFANSVVPSAWPVFRKHLEIAKTILSRSKAQACVDPEWYAEMEEAVIEEPDESGISSLFREATQRSKYFPDTYYAVMRGLEPQWRGSIKAMEDFTAWAAEYTKDRMGQQMYARLYWHISPCGCDVMKVVNWPRMRTGFSEIVKAYPTQWNLNGFAHLACMAKDRAATRTAMQRVTEPLMNQWDDSVQYYAQCRAWALGS